MLNSAAQHVAPNEELVCPEGTGPVRSSIFHGDSACTSFLPCIDPDVRPHPHRTRTEHVFILDGTAEEMLGDRTRNIKAGNTILIPVGTPHAVKVTGDAPLCAISGRSPYFDGRDRAGWTIGNRWPNT